MMITRAIVAISAISYSSSSPPCPPTPRNAAAISTLSSPRCRARRGRRRLARRFRQAFAGVTHDPAVMAFDRRQRGTFRKSFEEYAATRVDAGRVKRGRAMMQRHAALLARIEQRFGVPPEIDRRDLGPGDRQRRRHGQAAGRAHARDPGARLPPHRAVPARAASRAADSPARRPAARADVGAYAGEIGQTQFLPSSYVKYGVDFDGNGHVDLRRSVPDVLASTANC